MKWCVCEREKKKPNKKQTIITIITLALGDSGRNRGTISWDIENRIEMGSNTGYRIGEAFER